MFVFGIVQSCTSNGHQIEARMYVKSRILKFN